MSIKDQFEAARLRMGAWARERKERAEERKLERATQSGGDGHETRFFLLTVPATATLLAAFTEFYWAALFCIEATGHLDGSWSSSLGSTPQPPGAWVFGFEIRSVFVLLGLICATVPIVLWSMVWLPVQMKARGQGRWRRVTMITAGLLANALVIVSGTIVMNGNRQEQVRANLVVEQSADQGRAALVAQRDAIHQRWATLTDSSNTTLQAQAARAGVAGWNAYIATARQQAQAGTITPARLALIERAIGGATAAEKYQADEDAMTGRIAAAAPAAATAANVRDDVGAGMNTFAQYAAVYRPPFVAMICTIIGIFGAWWLVGLMEAMNRHNVSLSGWADEAHRIEDHSAEDPLEVDPAGMRPAREKFIDPETGEEYETATVKAFRRRIPKKAKKGEKLKVNLQPEPLPDETGAQPGTGDERLAHVVDDESVYGVADDYSEGEQAAVNEHVFGEPVHTLSPEPQAHDARDEQAAADASDAEETDGDAGVVVHELSPWLAEQEAADTTAEDEASDEAESEGAIVHDSPIPVSDVDDGLADFDDLQQDQDDAHADEPDAEADQDQSDAHALVPFGHDFDADAKAARRRAYEAELETMGAK